VGKRIKIGEKYFRERRGKLVEIPTAWLGVVPTGATMRKRPSRLTHKIARAVKHTTKGGIHYIDGRHQMIDAEA
jgi:hypothetical protein